MSCGQVHQIWYKRHHYDSKFSTSSKLQAMNRELLLHQLKKQYLLLQQNLTHQNSSLVDVVSEILVSLFYYNGTVSG
jgi:hypothetical protein